jgi:hypothetical protein
MQTLQPTQTTQVAPRPRRPKAIIAFAVAIVVAVGATIAIWAITKDDGPVAAKDARLELTFTGDDASYVGDRKITVGLAEVVLVNDANRPIWFVVQYFEPGSAALQAELDRGDDFVTDGSPPGQTPIFEELDPGRVTRSISLKAGTYLLTAAEASEENVHVWQPGVVEVVSD